MARVTRQMKMTLRQIVRPLLVIHGFEIVISVIKHPATKTERLTSLYGSSYLQKLS